MIGTIIKEAREAQRIGFRELATAAGISTGTLWRVENGEPPHLSTLDAIARVIGKPRWQIIKEADERAQQGVQ